MTTLNNKAVDVTTGNAISDEDVSNAAAIALKKFGYKWLYIYKLDEYN